MNKELWMVFLPAVSWALFALGGTQISDKIKGQKWIRRFVLPVFYGLCILPTFGWLKALIVTGLAIGFFCMGYGDGKSWLYRLMIGCLYGCISIPIGFGLWNIFTALGFFLFFVASNWDYTKEEFTWSLCSGFYGLLIGITIALPLMK